MRRLGPHDPTVLRGLLMAFSAAHARQSLCITPNRAMYEPLKNDVQTVTWGIRAASQLGDSYGLALKAVSAHLHQFIALQHVIYRRHSSLP